MRVLHVIAGDLSGGAARGAMWLIEALRAQGIVCDVLNNDPASAGVEGVTAPIGIRDQLRARWWKQIEVALKVAHLRRRRTSFSSGMVGMDLTAHPLYRDADIVHLHWINQGFVRVSKLAKITKPLIWTLRDLWAATGGCHYPLDCEKFTLSCGACPQLGSKNAHDLTFRAFREKLQKLPDRLVGVGISRWVTEQVARSPIMLGKELRTIANGVPLHVFYPSDKADARRALELPATGKVVLVGAQRLDGFYKGLEYFLQAAALLDPSLTVLVFGGADRLPPLRQKTVHLGYVRDDVRLRMAYAAADVFVAPSVQEAFGKTLVEAMACGTPVVAFDTAGPRDIVAHLDDGYLARPYLADDLARGVNWVLCDDDRHRRLSAQALESARAKFDINLAATRYMELYEHVLNRGS